MEISEEARKVQNLLGEAVQTGEVTRDRSDLKQVNKREREAILKELVWKNAMRSNPTKGDLELACRVFGVIKTKGKQDSESNIDDAILKQYEQVTGKDNQ